MEKAWKKEAIADVINLVLAAWLFLSPWIFGIVSEPMASWNAWLSGLVIGAVAIAALAKFAEWEEWLNLVLGLWVLVSPWVLGFTTLTTARWVHVIVGLIVAVVAGLKLWLMHQMPPQVTTRR